LARTISLLSRIINRQIGLLIDRRGRVAYVVVGDAGSLPLPDLSGFRTGGSRLRGLRLIHTHLKREALSDDDLSALILQRLDLTSAIKVDDKGAPREIEYAHILANPSPDQPSLDRDTAVHIVPDIGHLNVNFLDLVTGLEAAFSRPSGHRISGRERALLVGVTTGPRRKAEEAIGELEELALSDDVEVAGKVVHQVKAIDPKFFIGKGKLKELASRCLTSGCTMIIFDSELSPTQVRNLSDFTELKIIDRSQLILDIFASRAVTREGKIQVELAQLRYMLPRLAEKSTALSRLTGGIGGRGPGETKLEVNRRRIKSRIARLNRELEEIKGQRMYRRRLRDLTGLPVISIVGYTNAGKSTLLNALTRSSVAAGHRMFETLDPTSRRLRFPSDREAVITDTVGFIKDLPESLMQAFSATLEELEDADLLLHVVDSSSTGIEERINTVDEVLGCLGLHQIPRLLVLNKTDLISRDEASALERKMNGVAVSALRPATLPPLVKRISETIWLRYASPMS
jgi:GTP-binding protein HflX